MYLAAVVACGLAGGPLVPLPHGDGSVAGLILAVPLSVGGGFVLLRPTDSLGSALRLGLLTAAVFAAGWILALTARGLVLPTPFSAFVVALVAVASLFVVLPLLMAGVLSGWSLHSVPRFVRWLVS